VPDSYDAVVVGAGPNGLAAAVEIARNGRSVLVLEAAETIGGGTRTEEVTLPGFRHDTCSGIHPMGAFSPYFRQLPLAEHGLEWLHPEIPLAHPLDDGTAVLVHRSVEQTADNLEPDARAYQRLMAPLVRNYEKLGSGFLRPLLKPKAPFTMAKFGLIAIRSAQGFVSTRFEGERARAMFAGNAAHFMLPLDKPVTAAAALVYNIFAHSVGWPLAKGGSQAIADSLASYLRSLGGTIECGRKITTLAEIPSSRVVLFDLSPKQVRSIAGDELPQRYHRALNRFKYGPGVFKIDWALDAPIPWKAEECGRTTCLHLGGTLEEIARSEAETNSGRHAERPWVIVAQQSLVDPTRAPAGKHTAWGYCHVPAGSDVDMTSVVEDQIERFAPGFRDVVLARATKTAVQMEEHNANYVGGDISSGAATLRQIIARPVLRWSPHATPNPKLFLCSQSTPPGPGVHGMCGYFAARTALRRL
jgi:phytoene dehydrogenase-like protein